MINKSSNESTLEKIYKNLESGMPENKSIKEYALPNARQWLGGSCLLYTSPSPRDRTRSRMPSSA